MKRHRGPRQQHSTCYSRAWYVQPQQAILWLSQARTLRSRISASMVLVMLQNMMHNSCGTCQLGGKMAQMSLRASSRLSSHLAQQMGCSRPTSTRGHMPIVQRRKCRCHSMCAMFQQRCWCAHLYRLTVRSSLAVSPIVAKICTQRLRQNAGISLAIGGLLMHMIAVGSPALLRQHAGRPHLCVHPHLPLAHGIDELVPCLQQKGKAARQEG